MNWPDLFLFIPLAVLCNTLFPVPFDPVLIFFASRQSTCAACVLAVLGSVCAGIAAAADVKLFQHVHTRAPEKWLKLLPLLKGRRIYVLTFLFALLPLPFSVVRLAALRHPPRMIPFQLSVVVGRLPRYLITILLWPGLGFSGNGAVVLLCVVVGIAAFRWLRRAEGDGVLRPPKVT